MRMSRLLTRTKRPIVVLIATAPALLGVVAFQGGPAAFATITGTTGQVVKIAPPASVHENALESDTQMFAFDEQQNLVLPSSVHVDVTQAGTVAMASQLSPGDFPAGTAVDSHLMTADPVGSPLPANSLRYIGSITL